VSLLGGICTRPGAVLVADGLMTNDDGTPFKVQQKIWQTGSHTAAGIVGCMAWGPGQESTVHFMPTFERMCASFIHRNIPLSVQVSRLASRFASEANSTYPIKDNLASLRDSDNTLGVVIGAGFEGRARYVARCHVRFIDGRFAVSSIERNRHYLFAGTLEVLKAILDDGDDISEQISAAIDPLRRLKADNVEPTMEEGARAAQCAIEATIKHGARYGLAPVPVGWPADIIQITPLGVEHRCFNECQT
jgi:hypothetical protein